MPRPYKNKWNDDEYDYYNLKEKHTAAELKKEYRRMRKEAESRLKSLSRSRNETAKALYSQYRDVAGKAPRNKIQYAKAIIGMEHFLSLKTSKVSNIYKAHRASLESLQEHGYTFVTDNNVRDFGRFMEYMRDCHYARKGSSSMVMEFLSERGKVGKNKEKLKEDFEKWMIQQGKDPSVLQETNAFMRKRMRKNT